MEVLPDEAYLTLHLTYYEERTPEDYQPPGFHATDTEFRCDNDESVKSFKTTAIKAKFHGLQVEIRSRDLTDDELEAMVISTQEATQSQVRQN